MHTQEVSNIVHELFTWFPRDILPRNYTVTEYWSKMIYDEGVKYLNERYKDKEIHLMERSKIFWNWWRQTWIIVDQKFIGACKLGCFTRDSIFTLEHYIAEHEKGTYFMPESIHNLILNQPIPSHDKASKLQKKNKHPVEIK